jgi:hypothetical protein
MRERIRRLNILVNNAAFQKAQKKFEDIEGRRFAAHV